jgi:hypothetical protein
MNDGWVKLHRTIFQKDMHPRTRDIFLWLVANAQFKDAGKLRRGELKTSVPEIMKALEWKQGSCIKRYKYSDIENSLVRLRITERITVRRTERGVIVTICNYDVYQSDYGTDYGADKGVDKGAITERFPYIEERKKESTPQSPPLSEGDAKSDGFDLLAERLELKGLSREMYELAMARAQLLHTDREIPAAKAARDRVILLGKRTAPGPWLSSFLMNHVSPPPAGAIPFRNGARQEGGDVEFAAKVLRRGRRAS